MNFFRGFEYDPTVDWEAMWDNDRCGFIKGLERVAGTKRTTAWESKRHGLMFSLFRRSDISAPAITAVCGNARLLAKYCPFTIFACTLPRQAITHELTMDRSIDAPQQYKQPSRKGKGAWRKNVDVSEVLAGLDEARDEVIQGLVHN